LCSILYVSPPALRSSAAEVGFHPTETGWPALGNGRNGEQTPWFEHDSNDGSSGSRVALRTGNQAYDLYHGV